MLAETGDVGHHQMVSPPHLQQRAEAVLVRTEPVQQDDILAAAAFQIRPDPRTDPLRSPPHPAQPSIEPAQAFDERIRRPGHPEHQIQGPQKKGQHLPMQQGRPGQQMVAAWVTAKCPLAAI
jgi:hypothetical protein